MKEQLGAALRVFLLMTLITGGVYPVVITVFAQIGYPHQANGSLIKWKDRVVGSELIAQKFNKTTYFWPRPSAVDFSPMPSGGSNFGPTSQGLKESVEARRKLGLEGDLLFASGSGLDPHISVASAQKQVVRVVEGFNFPQERQKNAINEVAQLVEAQTEERQLLIFGEPRVNVLKLNLALEEWLNREGPMRE